MNYETLEDALSAFVAALEDERSANWKAGDIVSDIVETYGNKVIGNLPRPRIVLQQEFTC